MAMIDKDLRQIRLLQSLMVSSKDIEEEVDQPIIKAEEEDPIEVVIIIKIRIFIKVVIKQISLSLSLQFLL